MDSITDYFEQAEFALAAYSNLNSDMSFDDYVLALRDDGKSFSFSQATTFADTYRVVDQYNDLTVVFPPRYSDMPMMFPIPTVFLQSVEQSCLTLMTYLRACRLH